MDGVSHPDKDYTSMLILEQVPASPKKILGHIEPSDERNDPLVPGVSPDKGVVSNPFIEVPP
jgi:hypothetical protein